MIDGSDLSQKTKNAQAKSTAFDLSSDGLETDARVRLSQTHNKVEPSSPRPHSPLLLKAATPKGDGKPRHLESTLALLLHCGLLQPHLDGLQIRQSCRALADAYFGSDERLVMYKVSRCGLNADDEAFYLRYLKKMRRPDKGVNPSESTMMPSFHRRKELDRIFEAIKQTAADRKRVRKEVPWLWRGWLKEPQKFRLPPRRKPFAKNDVRHFEQKIRFDDWFAQRNTSFSSLLMKKYNPMTSYRIHYTWDALRALHAWSAS